MNKGKQILLILLACTFLVASPTLAQDQPDELNISFTRNFGFGGFGKIQGTFTLKVQNPDGFTKVEYLLDGEVINTTTESPFKYTFNTGSFPVGVHTISAVGYLSDGSTIQAPEVSREFISSSDAWSNTGSMVIPILAAVAVVAVLGAVIPVLMGRKRTHKPGVYGAAGGAVCRKCTMPFSRNFLAPNLLVGKLERCPHCGHWSIVPAAPAAALKAAEERLAADSEGEIKEVSEEESLRRMIDDSRYDG